MPRYARMRIVLLSTYTPRVGLLRVYVINFQGWSYMYVKMMLRLRRDDPQGGKQITAEAIHVWIKGGDEYLS